MQIKTNELINFSHYCSENSLKFPSERVSNLIKFLQNSQHDEYERDISFIYSLLPSNREEKEKLKELIHKYFNFLVDDYTDQSSFLLDYKDEIVEDFFNEKFKKTTAAFNVKIISIKEKNLPEVDDNFAKLMDPSINDLKELKKQKIMFGKLINGQRKRCF